MQSRLWLHSIMVLLVVGLGAHAHPARAEASGASVAAPVLGLAVEPGGLLIQGVEPGELYDLEQTTGILLTIRNRDRADHTYLLSTHRPSEVGNRRLPPGYSDVVDPSWLSFEQPEVRVPAQGSSRVRMYLEIPDNERYRNQHWSVSIGVAGRPERGETLTLAVYPRYEVETAAAPRSELRLRPAGDLAFAPSVLELGLSPGSTQTGEVIICNNEKRKHWYRFTVAPRGEPREGVRLFPTGGYDWLPNLDWISLLRPRRRSPYPGWSASDWPVLWLGGRRYLGVKISLSIPEDVVLPETGWETVVFVERDDGVTGFFRVRARAGERS